MISSQIKENLPSKFSPVQSTWLYPENNQDHHNIINENEDEASNHDEDVEYHIPQREVAINHRPLRDVPAPVRYGNLIAHTCWCPIDKP